MDKTLIAAATLAATLAAGLLAGCDTRSDSTVKPAEVPVAAAAHETVAAVLPSTGAPDVTSAPTSIAVRASARPGPTERDPRPALEYWRTALEQHRYPAARSVWGDNGAASGMSAAEFSRAWDKYRIIDITVGQGDQEGAAGSSFYDVPVTITGLTRTGRPYHLAGTVTLRRVNDVDGATPEQLRWHIERSTLVP